MFTRIKNWLKKSSIISDLTEKNISLNPFEEIFENKSYPMARIYRENFWTALKDSYSVLVGKHDVSGREREGILDYLIFPIIARHLNAYSSNVKNNFIIRRIARGVGGILNITRDVLGIALTLTVSPIVGFVHLATRPNANKLKEAVAELPIVEIKYELKEVIAKDNKTNEIIFQQNMLLHEETESSLTYWMKNFEQTEYKNKKTAKLGDITSEFINGEYIFHYNFDRNNPNLSNSVLPIYSPVGCLYPYQSNECFKENYIKAMDYISATTPLKNYINDCVQSFENQNEEINALARKLNCPRSEVLCFFPPKHKLTNDMENLCKFSIFKTRANLQNPKTKSEKAFNQLNIAPTRALGK